MIGGDPISFSRPVDPTPDWIEILTDLLGPGVGAILAEALKLVFLDEFRLQPLDDPVVFLFAKFSNDREDLLFMTLSQTWDIEKHVVVFHPFDAGDPLFPLPGELVSVGQKANIPLETDGSRSSALCAAKSKLGGRPASGAIAQQRPPRHRISTKKQRLFQCYICTSRKT